MCKMWWLNPSQQLASPSRSLTTPTQWDEEENWKSKSKKKLWVAIKTV